MTIDGVSRDIFVEYVLWLIICNGLYQYTPLGDGWRRDVGQRVVFTPPWFPRVVFLTSGLFGPATFLLDQTMGQFNNSILLSVFTSFFFILAIGIQEFSADVEAGTYYTRRGLPGFAPKKTGRQGELNGVQMRRGVQYAVFVTRAGDEKWGGFQIGAFSSRNRASAAAEHIAEDLHIPLLAPIR